MTEAELLEEAEAEEGVAFHEPASEPHAVIPHAIIPRAAAGASDLFAHDSLAPPASQPRRRSSLLTAAWAASFAALALLGVAGYAKRDQLMRHWPASIRVYAMFGLAQSGGAPAVKPGP
jgi:hypothetical protein